MVLITPRLVRALEPDEVPPLPTLPRRFLPAPGVGGVEKGAPGNPDKTEKGSEPSGARRSRRRREGDAETGQWPGSQNEVHALQRTHIPFGAGSRLRPGRHLAVRPDGVQRVRARLRDDVDRPAAGAERRRRRRARWSGRARVRRLRRSAVVRRRRSAERQQVAAANLVWQQAGTPVVHVRLSPGVTGHVRQGRRVSATARTAALRCPRSSVRSSASRPGRPSDSDGDRRQRQRHELPASDRVPDDWLDQRTPATEFNSYDEATGLPLTADRDVYTAAKRNAAGRPTTHPADDFGERIIWRAWAVTTITDAVRRPDHSRLVLALTLPGSACTFQQNVDTLQRPDGGARTDTSR